MQRINATVRSATAASFHASPQLPHSGVCTALSRADVGQVRGRAAHVHARIEVPLSLLVAMQRLNPAMAAGA